MKPIKRMERIIEAANSLDLIPDDDKAFLQKALRYERHRQARRNQLRALKKKAARHMKKDPA